ncbi:MAG: cobalamin-independent methionine synthase II family protein [Kiloniellales bacterium]|nr:cobalamin-independent methionine synthase II family protein [Kiloniellales bacterium]
MALVTTTIGAYPKPGYVPIVDWFAKDMMETAKPTRAYQHAMEKLGGEAEEIFCRAAGEVIADQVSCGIDIPTDGEVRRENYIHYHCRHLDGFDFDQLTLKSLRNEAYSVELPRVIGPVKAGPPFLPHDWKAAQSTTDRPVKVTLPGPMTITDTTANHYYPDEKSEGRDLSEALNKEVRALADAGCRYIQIDEPVFARKPAEALAFGMENLERCWHGVPDSVVKTVHMCCGYPNKMDDEDYPKADQHAYLDLAKAVDQSVIDAVSIEDAHRHNDLRLLDLFGNTTIILGLIAIAKSRIETVEEVRCRILEALEHIPAERLIAAPDCGLGYMDRSLAMAKLKVLSEAAKSL